MKILYIVQNLNRIASNTVALGIIFNLRDKLDEIYLVSLYKSGEDNYKNELQVKGISFIEFNDLQDALCNISKLVTIVKSYDIIHMHQYKSNEYANLLQKFNPNIKLISTCHSAEDIEDKNREYKGNAKIASIVRLREQSNFFRKHNRVIAISNYVKQYLLRANCEEQNIQIIHSGIDYKCFPKLKQKEKNGYINLCQVGHILKLKNQLFSINLIKYLIDNGLKVKLHFYGGYKWDRDYYLFLKEYIQKNQLSQHIIFYGELSFNKLFNSLQNMDVLLVPSTTEGLSLALLEAFYFEIPAIVSNHGGMKEILEHNKTGLVVDINDEKSNTDIYTYLNSKKYIKDGKIDRKIALEEFNAEKMAFKYLKEYNKFLDIKGEE